MIRDEPGDTDRQWPVAPDRQSARRAMDHFIATRKLSQEQAQFIWDKFLAPLYDIRQARADWPRQLCRVCQAKHPAHPRYDSAVSRREHRMLCPKYTGPLEHRGVRSSWNILGDLRIECLCGKSYAETDHEGISQECPDRHIDWRGPRPVA